MNNQNDMFSNMMQPNAIPEVKDNSNSGMVGNNVNNSLNQVNDGFLFGIPQNGNVASSTVGADMMSQNNSGVGTNAVNMVDNNSFINNQMVSEPVNLNNNVVQNNNNNLDFGFGTNNNQSFDNLNMNTQANAVVDVNSNVNSMEQPSLQPVNDTINFGGDNIGESSLLNNGDSVNSTITNPLTDLLNANNNGNGVKTDIDVSNNKSEKVEEVVSVKEYLVHILLCCIPIVGIIILIMRALDRKDKNISNLARAQLLISATLVLLSVVFMFVMGSMVISIFGNI